MTAKTEADEWQNCFICSEYMGPFRNELSVPTGFSEKTLYQLFGKINKKNIELFSIVKYLFRYFRVVYQSKNVR